ncbi:MAG TPA: MFS transporter [Caulobacteraceae bacterium]|jgi:EmrB/QacA subfamily drug resistance transporter
MAREGHAGARPRLVLAATVLASSIDWIDGSVVNVGLPAIGKSLHGQADALQWVVNGYLLPLSALLMFGGALGDRFGKRRLLVIGIAAFAAGSAGCAAAPTLGWLIAARALQGLAAAMMLPNSLAVLGGSFEGSARSRAVGVWAASGSMAAAVGPVLGGWLIDTVGWRAIFLINLPLAAVAAGLTLYAVAPSPRAAQDARLDLGGAALITLALAGLTWGLTEGAGKAGWTPAAIGAVVAGAVLAAAFVRIELKLGDQAMTPPALFGARPLVALNLLTLLLYGALAGFLLLLPYLLITVVGYSATAAGAALLPFPLISAALSPVMGDFAGRVGARWPLIAGASLVAAGCLLAPLAAHGGAYWLTVAPSVVLLALGMACAAAPLTAAILSAVDSRHTGAASGLNSAVAQLGGVIAIALIGAVLAQRGAAFVSAFNVVAIAGALVAVAAAAAIAFLYEGAHSSRPARA